tara:strand:- start:1924 stop:3231 length:1308 start_codon:yes stop_codon:yes gene_type:complete
MNDYKYILEPYKSSKNRYKCPSCGKANQFTRYINTELDEYVDDKVGICNRIEKCGYHLTPKEYFMSLIGSGNTPSYRFKAPEPITPLANRYNEVKPITFLDKKILSESYHRPIKNNFLKYLESLFGNKQMKFLKKEYLIGTTELDSTRVDFFQVDVNSRIRQVKNMGYNPETGKKENVYFTYSKSKYPDYNLVQCFFGEHLLNKYPEKKVGIVESEKTAIIASSYINEFVWLAAGNANGLNLEKTKVLKGREVILYPDLGQYDNWKEKIRSLNQEASYSVSKLLLNNSTSEERKNGYDIADYLILKDWGLFRSKVSEPQLKETTLLGNDQKVHKETISPLSNEEVFRPEPVIIGELEDWKPEIMELENYFENIELPNKPVKLQSYGMILNTSLFVKSHLAIIKRHNGKRTFSPYLNRLNELKQILKQDLIIESIN